jgi:hypothetical protein
MIIWDLHLNKIKISLRVPVSSIDRAPNDTSFVRQE